HSSVAPTDQKSRSNRNAVIYSGLGFVLVLFIVGFLYLRSARAPISVVAILPLANESNDPNAEYLSDGITESITNTLSQLPELKVMSRNAAFRFKNRKEDPKTSGRSLNVGAVLTGRLGNGWGQATNQP